MTAHHPPPQVYAWPVPRPSHPHSTRALVLGIVGLVGFFILLVPVALSPLAWYFGAAAQRDIDLEPVRWSGRGEAKTGMILGMIGTGLLILGLMVFSLAVAGIAFVATFDSGYGS